MPRIDVAIPNYNYGRFLNQCVDSVLSQGIDDVRILIIDNASTDNSVAIAREIAARDSRVELRLNERNQGQHASFNAGIDWASSEYFTILCADDRLPPGALQRAICALDKFPDANLVFGKTLFLSDGKATPPGTGQSVAPQLQHLRGRELLEEFCRTGRNPVDGPMTIVRTKTQKRVGHYDPALRHTDDVEMWMRFTLHGGAIRIDEVQCIAREHSANQSAVVTNVHLWNVEMEAAFDTFFARCGLSLEGADRLRGVARRSLSDRAYWCAVSHLVRGEGGVRDLFRFATRLRPLSLVIPPVEYLWQRADAWDRIVTTVRRRKRLVGMIEHV